ncbi:MAG: hypothetical protein ABIO71_14225 [Caldimonas sp.]
MGLSTFALNVTQDGCCDRQDMVADDEMRRYWTHAMDAAGALHFGRQTYEVMGDACPDRTRAVKALTEAAPRLVGNPQLTASLQSQDLVDEYRCVVHPGVARHPVLVPLPG